MTGDVTPMLEEITPPWKVHVEPDRPLDAGAILCASVGCEAAILAQAGRTPRDE